MTTTTEVHSIMNPFVRVTMHKLALLFAAAAFTVSTPCFAGKLSQPQVAVISGNMDFAKAIASSALGPAAAQQYAQAINAVGTGINDIVDDLHVDQAHAAPIKGLVDATNAIAAHVGIASDQHQRPRAELRQRTRAGNHTRQQDCVGAVDLEHGKAY
jgi:hypothetical protein